MNGIKTSIFQKVRLTNDIVTWAERLHHSLISVASEALNDDLKVGWLKKHLTTRKLDGIMSLQVMFSRKGGDYGRQAVGLGDFAILIQNRYLLLLDLDLQVATIQTEMSATSLIKMIEFWRHIMARSHEMKTQILANHNIRVHWKLWCYPKFWRRISHVCQLWVNALIKYWWISILSPLFRDFENHIACTSIRYIQCTWPSWLGTQV